MSKLRLVEGASKKKFAWEIKPRGRQDGIALISPELRLSKFGKVFFKKNPAVIADFLRMPILAFEESYKSPRGVVIRRLPEQVNGLAGTSYYQVKAKGKSFFVKEMLVGKTGELFDTSVDLPSKQADAIKKTRTVLSRLKGFDDFEVVNWHLAFVGRKKAYFVTDWHGTVRYSDLGYKKRKADAARIDALAQHMRKNQVYDILAKNILYNRRLKKYVIIDPRYDPFSGILD